MNLETGLLSTSSVKNIMGDPHDNAVIILLGKAHRQDDASKATKVIGDTHRYEPLIREAKPKDESKRNYKMKKTFVRGARKSPCKQLTLI